ncbi:uncharacterized protein MJAP1_003324 [Malassezia japonica]|uniref:Uncharacterized protein n=1 Tax=Malassezia japonica TaxID=223818 RepID=A0AAF0F065_9BASI|nr:uncharacterized protein MJAP1_003324 [Malassezia japonica]WFD40338.1 hypothetical protein MJAP1_003324 [Malassezia japonica]
MFRTTLVRAARAHKPSITFPNRRAQQETHEPHPHPDAPPEIAKDFDNFRKTFESGPHFNPDKVVKPDVSSGEQDAISGASSVFDLPPRFWDTPSMRYSPVEMEAINSGGAALMDA